LPKVLEIRVGPPRDALDRFEAAWNRLAEGQKVQPYRVLSLEDLPAFARALTPARWALLESIRKEGPASIYELAKRLGRDYKNVHTDVSALLRINVAEKDPQGRICVGWDAVRAEMRF
jgi:predicted transcriptional regulator